MLQLSIEIEEKGSTKKYFLLPRKDLSEVDKNKEVMIVTLNGYIYTGKTNAWIDNQGFFKIKNEQHEFNDYIYFQDVYGWCYKED